MDEEYGIPERPERQDSVRGQLTARGVVVGIIGCIVITAASVYIALRMGALPWPIVFAAIVALVFLRAVSHGKASLNEANVTHTLMSAGAMVAGGLAFTLPGAWMLGQETPWFQVTVVTFSGVALGLIATALMRRHFVESAALEYPIGEAAAQTLKAGKSGGSFGKKLFTAMGISGVYGFLRDGLGLLPTLFAALPIPGVTFGIYNSPMMLAIGFLVGTSAVVIWFIGAVIGNFGIIVAAPALGLCDLTTATAITASLGMGLMVGSGIGVIARDILPKGVLALKNHAKAQRERGRLIGLTATSTQTKPSRASGGRVAGAALVIAAVALLLCWWAQLSPLACVIVVGCSFITCAMSAQSCGQTGIDPMEIFGLIVLLLVAATGSADTAQLFLIAALIAVACGLAGDVMNDFHAGWRLGTSPKAQWIAQAIGSFIGAAIAIAVMVVLLDAYGPDAFGPGKTFVAAQASVVATTISGIPNVWAFVIGILAGFGLYLVRFPSMMLGLGVYLPFYMSFTAFLGSIVSLIYRKVRRTITLKRQDATDLDDDERRRAVDGAIEEDGMVIASGFLGGESIVGIILALVLAGSALFAG